MKVCSIYFGLRAFESHTIMMAIFPVKKDTTLTLSKVAVFMYASVLFTGKYHSISGLIRYLNTITITTSTI